jgi:hypothetical protein
MERKSIAGEIEEAEGNNIETFERFQTSHNKRVMVGLAKDSVETLCGSGSKV